MQVCTTLQTDNHASTPPLSFLQTGCLSCRPTNSVKALKAQIAHDTYLFKMFNFRSVTFQKISQQNSLKHRATIFPQKAIYTTHRDYHQNVHSQVNAQP